MNEIVDISLRDGAVAVRVWSRQPVYDEEKPSTRFTNIAGYGGSTAEMMEVVDFRKHPERYAGVVG